MAIHAKYFTLSEEKKNIINYAFARKKKKKKLASSVDFYNSVYMNILTLW